MAKIVIVDDEIAILESLELILASAGYETLTFDSAQSASEALRNLENQIPDLIISDIVMPKMSGLALVNELRDGPKFSDIPIILISASITPAKEDEISAMRLVTFLRKPFKIDDLFRAVAQYCIPISE